MAFGSEDLLRAMLESVGEGIYSVDQAGRCTFINQIAAALLGYRAEELLGREMHALIHHTKPDGSAYPAEECPVRIAFQSGKPFEVRDDILWRRDGTSIPVDGAVRPFLTGSEAAGAMVTIRDLTERQRAEAALIERGRVAALTADVALALTRGNTLPEMLNMCTEALVEHLDAAFARVWTVDAAKTTLELQASAGMYTHLDGPHARVPVGKFKIGWIAQERVPHLTNDVVNDPRVGDHEWAKQNGLISFAGYPLIVDGEMTGVVALFARHELQPDTLRSLASVANSIALGIRRKRTDVAIRDSEANNKAILETSLDCVVIIDGESRILEWNPAAERTFGRSRAEVLGKQMPELIMPAAYHELHRKGMRHYFETGEGPVIATRIEVSAVRADGSEFPVELAINRIDRPDATLFTATLRDITERKQAQEDLRQAKESAEGANQAKSSFLANMSHELRTPLNAILGYSEMLLEEARETGDETLSKDLNRINSAGKHLLNLIGDILDLSKIDAGRMDLYPETFAVDTLVADVASTVGALIERNSNVLETVTEPGIGTMFADMTKVRQNLFNLLSNAAKFTSNGRIRLEVSSDRENGRDDVLFAVTDTGRGIPPERMDQLFQPFMQLDKSITRDFGGTGLGLTITRRFCQMMGGDVAVQSEVGRGSTFTIRLPRLYTPLKTEEPAEAAEPATGKMLSEGDVVLVIDDDPAARDLIYRNLTRSGLKAAVAESGEQGLKMARELRPTAITLDVLMPGMDGWAVLQELKSDPDLRDIPVVMATMVADRSLGYSLGAADYLMKPITRDRLQTTLAKYKCEPPPCTVLLVEDDTDSRDLLHTMLKREGWHVVLAADGLEALARMEERVPTVILLDLMMPNMDGFEFTVHLNNREEWRKVPVLVVTAKNLTEQERSRLNGHVERILSKDAREIEQLLREVRSLVAACIVKKSSGLPPAGKGPQAIMGTVQHGSV